MTQDGPKAPHTPQSFAAWLRDRLLKRGYPERGGQQRFAKESGISPATVSRLLRAEGLPDVRTLGLLAEALRVPLGEILVRAGVATPEDLAAAARPINPNPITAAQAAAELGITDPQSVAAFETMVAALRATRPDDRSANG
ncbi:helix-turn-helix transcriptional regulator [Streptomyces sp. RKAG293]|uniref:helix-turn-helix domain-containing protein n=1 Tax=Streptomyces sp. RKAG293 TaxID=2893403 RepID=UPI00203403C1|nr:helix-turn-helix transcriptional regulator [Streptomyces sp. RKAG293]MCM2420276.1 helix-turn-helix domain-containing protein [Streptomyces sp. RKAG293]